MKKLFVTLIILQLFAFLVADAQSKFGFGIKAGINISDQYTSGLGENVDMKSILRYNGGAWFNYFFIDKLALQTELMVSGKGSNWIDPYFDLRDLLTYIDLPLLIRYQPIGLLNIHAGPQFGYMLSANQKNNETGNVVNIDDYYKKLDIGLVAGVEANLPASINVTVRYVFGLIPTTTDVEYIEPWRNNFIQVSAGYRFKGK